VAIKQNSGIQNPYFPQPSATIVIVPLFMCVRARVWDTECWDEGLRVFVLGIAILVCGACKRLLTEAMVSVSISKDRSGGGESMLPIIFIGMLELHISTRRFLVAERD
jgi:hypothetical protein